MKKNYQIISESWNKRTFYGPFGNIQEEVPAPHRTVVVECEGLTYKFLVMQFENIDEAVNSVLSSDSKNQYIVKDLK